MSFLGPVDPARFPAPENPTEAWIFDVDRRRYEEGSRGGPIWREHWCRREITGETSRSWLVSGGRWAPVIKIPKRMDAIKRREFAWSEHEIACREWEHLNRHKIAERVSRTLTLDQLVAVAAAIGYPVLPPE